MTKTLLPIVFVCASSLGLLTLVQAQEQDQDEAAPEYYSFGKRYLRVFVEDVYLPDMHKTTPVLALKIRTVNKAPLEFPWQIEGKEGERYSSKGPYLAAPFFALNTKGPLAIEASLKSHRPVNGGLNRGLQFLQTLQPALAPLVQISGLATYSQAATTAISGYSTATTLTDYNYAMMPDDVNKDTLDLKKSKHLFVFSQGRPMFTATNRKDGKKMWITAAMIEGITPLATPMSKRQATPFLYRVRQGRELVEMVPTGKEAVMVLRFEKYLPYVNIDSEQMRKNDFASIPEVGNHFAHLTELGRKYKGKEAFVGAVAEATDEFSKTLRTLVGTGDLCLLDARRLVLAYNRRVNLLMPKITDTEVKKALETLQTSIPMTEAEKTAEQKAAQTPKEKGQAANN